MAYLNLPCYAGLGRLPDLNTLVIKNNSITELGDMLRYLFDLCRPACTYGSAGVHAMMASNRDSNWLATWRLLCCVESFVRCARGCTALQPLSMAHNRVADLGDSQKLHHRLSKYLYSLALIPDSRPFRGCTALEKLSMAHNEVSDLEDSLAGLPALQELRMGHNELTR